MLGGVETLAVAFLAIRHSPTLHRFEKRTQPTSTLISNIKHILHVYETLLIVGADDMLIILVLLAVCTLLAAGLFVASQWKRYRIRRSGTPVTAKVTQVHMWRDGTRADISLQSKMVPSPGGRWWYEIQAEWTDPHTGNTHVFSSGIRKGLPGYQRGDFLTAYISSFGTYLKLS